MAETAIDLRSSHREEADGSHTVIIQISGLPSMSWANRVTNWARDIIRANSHQIGRLDNKPPASQ